jgi:taurine transport system substrate-binding protein
MKSTAEFLKEAGRIDSTADDYAPFVTDEFVKAAQ